MDDTKVGTWTGISMPLLLSGRDQEPVEWRPGPSRLTSRGVNPTRLPPHPRLCLGTSSRHPHSSNVRITYFWGRSSEDPTALVDLPWNPFRHPSGVHLDDPEPDTHTPQTHCRVSDPPKQKQQLTLTLPDNSPFRSRITTHHNRVLTPHP